MDIVSTILSKFDMNQIFTSFSSFLGSGYIGILFVAILATSIAKKVMQLLILAIIVGVIWLLCTTGSLDAILEAI